MDQSYNSLFVLGDTSWPYNIIPSYNIFLNIKYYKESNILKCSAVDKFSDYIKVQNVPKEDSDELSSC